MGPPLTVLAESPVRLKHRWFIPPIFNRLLDLVEPVKFGTDDVLPILHDEGFRWVHTRNFDEICMDFTGTYERERKFRFQRLALSSRVPPDFG